MANYDNDILIQNVRSLMENNGVTQQKLADILRMPQSNVSKALNPQNKKSFTLDQVVGIAKSFNVSVDMLVGNNRARFAETSPRATAAFIAQLLQNHRGLLTEVEIEEDQFVVDYEGYNQGTSYNKVKSPYLCLYLPNYWPIPDNDPGGMTEIEYHQVGNDTGLESVNEFLHHFRELFTIYEKGGLSEETYNTVINELLGRLREI